MPVFSIRLSLGLAFCAVLAAVCRPATAVSEVGRKPDPRASTIRPSRVPVTRAARAA